VTNTSTPSASKAAVVRKKRKTKPTQKVLMKRLVDAMAAVCGNANESACAP